VEYWPESPAVVDEIQFAVRVPSQISYRKRGGIVTEQSRHAVAEIPWWAKALLSWGSSLILTLVVSVIVVAALYWNVPPFPTIERAGGDLGARLLWVGRVDEDVRPGFVFIDIDDAACRGFPTRRADDCRSGKPISAALIADLVRSLRESQATVVVVDVSPFESAKDRALLRAALVHNDGPWVIAPLEGRPAGENGVIRGDPSVDLVPEGAAGRLRLATFVAGTDGDAGDGLIRTFARATAYYSPTGSRRWVPSAPYLAAMLADETRARTADCKFYGLNCSGTPALERAHANDEPSAIAFSLPSLAMLDPENPDLSDTERWRARIQETRFADKGYMRLVGSKLLKEGRGRFPPLELARGRIVVIGSSHAGAMDVHATPLGPMAGSEILINAARAFARQGDMAPTEKPESEWGRQIKAKVYAALGGSMVMLPAWLLIQWLLALSPQRRLARFAAYLGVTAAFTSGMILALLLEFGEIGEVLKESIAIGRPVDVLTPVLLLGLEGYTEAVKAILGMLEHRIYLAVTVITAIGVSSFLRIKNLFFSAERGRDGDSGDSSGMPAAKPVGRTDDSLPGSSPDAGTPIADH
jgi:hypothetical protein